jgi:serine/threonine protein phosphatase PrpC
VQVVASYKLDITMFARWFENAFGQVTAPDPAYDREALVEDREEAVWQIMAPPPQDASMMNGAGNVVPPNVAAAVAAAASVVPAVVFQPPTSPASSTPVAVRGTANSPSVPAAATILQSPRIIPNSARYMTPTQQAQLQSQYGSSDAELILQCTVQMGNMLTSPTHAQDQFKVLWPYFFATSPLTEKQQASLRTLLSKKKYAHLTTYARVRTTDMGVRCPDGYTPLMVAALANNVPAAQILQETILTWESGGSESSGASPFFAELLNDRNLANETALHVAAKYGSVAMTDFLLEQARLNGLDLLLLEQVRDHCGLTPLGTALTSTKQNARAQVQQAERQLFSPDNPNLRHGTAASGGTAEEVPMPDELQLAYGVAEWPGKRILMEDAIGVDMWQQSFVVKGEASTDESSPPALVDESAAAPPTVVAPVALFSVCDGHGDERQCAQFVASQMPLALRQAVEHYKTKAASAVPPYHYDTEEWGDIFDVACAKVDEDLSKKRGYQGGTTGLFCLVTPVQLVVANVGDCRCIFIRHAEAAAATTASADTAAAHAEEIPSDTLPKFPTYCVQALSIDHKPNAPEEKSRIEHAGMTVIKVPTGDQSVVYRIQRRPDSNESMAVSRSFGDFEYKGNERLEEYAQAVVSVPDFVVHERHDERDAYIILGCDGIWDVMTNVQVAEFVLQEMDALQQESSLSPSGLVSQVADKLLRHCIYDLNTRDNVSVVIVALGSYAQRICSAAATSVSTPKKALKY